MAMFDVADAPLTLAALSIQGVPLAATEYNPVALGNMTVASFTDQDLSDTANMFDATIAWGEGNNSSPAVVVASGNPVASMTVATFTDQDLSDTASTFDAIIYWGVGSNNGSSEGTVVQDGPGSI